MSQRVEGLHYDLCLTSQGINQWLLQAIADINRKTQGRRCFCHLGPLCPLGNLLLMDLFIYPMIYSVFFHFIYSETDIWITADDLTSLGKTSKAPLTDAMP